VQIRELHAYATQTEVLRRYIPTRQFPTGGKRVAVVGGGPAGLGCAFELTKLGHPVILFEGKHIGGVPSTSIPSIRLSRETVESDLTFLTRHFAIEQRSIGSDDFEELRRGFSAIFIAIGLGIDRTSGIKGEDLRGVYRVLPYLEAAREEQARVPRGRKVIVVGGGNVSLDAAATAKRLGAEQVTLLYRRSEKELRVWNAELAQARAAGVQLRCLTLPVEIQGGRQVERVLCRRTELSHRLDSSGRPVPVEVPGSEHTFDADMVIVAIGQVLPKDVFPEIERDANGYFRVDPRLMTTLPGVFAGGDAIAGEGTIVQSVAQGKRAARSIHEYVMNGPEER
jgi:glutamate synthase (NADPH/NADH) small chain